MVLWAQDHPMRTTAPFVERRNAPTSGQEATAGQGGKTAVCSRGRKGVGALQALFSARGPEEQGPALVLRCFFLVPSSH